MRSTTACCYRVPEAQQLAIYIGWLLHRVPGGVIAGAFFVLPSIFILLALSYIYVTFGSIPAVAGAMAGFKPVVVAIVVEAVLKIGRRALSARAHYLIAAAAFIAIYFFHTPFPFIVLAAGVLGLIGARFWPAVFTKAPNPTVAGGNRSSAGGQTGNQTPIVIDDHAPPPSHTLPSRGRAVRTILVGVALWVLPFAALVWNGAVGAACIHRNISSSRRPR